MDALVTCRTALPRTPLLASPSQGVSQWSERRNDARESSSWNKKSTFSPSDPTSAAVGGYSGRPDRVQVLPSGPDHTFKASAGTPVNGGHAVNGGSHGGSHGGTRLYKTTSTHMVGAGERGPPGRSPVRSPRGSPYRDDSDEHNVSILQEPSRYPPGTL